MSASLRVLALGPFQVFIGDREIPSGAWKSRKARLVFEYLLTRELGRLVPKDAIMEALWPEEDPALSSQSLRAAISALRRTLEPDLPYRMSSRYVMSREGHCALALGDQGLFDVAEFSRKFCLATQLQQAGDAAGAAAARRAAIELYRGDFLEDEPYAEWALFRRERLRDQYSMALVQLGVYSLAQGDSSQAADLALRALEADAVLEPAYRLIISCYARSGQWGRVKALYERYDKLMKENDFPPPPSLSVLLS